MKYLAVFSITIVALIAIMSFSEKDMGITTLHFANAWHSTEGSHDRYLLISSPNMFMEGMIYVVHNGKVTQKNAYKINSSYRNGTEIFYTTYENSKPFSRKFQIVNNDFNIAEINQEQWAKVVDLKNIEKLKKLVMASR